ncbi:MAG: RnfH family protein [Chromatiaceae bacterium]|nr:MAG: RnfH family protein [Chromatiaceae bacterium]
MVTDATIAIEVAYARQHAQALLPLKLPAGTTAREAIERSGILGRFPEIDLAVNKIGIFGKLAKLEQVLQNGDRVEIYPPLIADPKEAVRKDRAGAKNPAGKAADDAEAAEDRAGETA